MKIYDCTTYYSEDLMLDIRFHVLTEYVHKFVVVESVFSHSGERKKLNFDINRFGKFKDKINYIVIDKEPEGINFVNEKNITSIIKRSNSLKRIEQSYDFMQKGIKDASDEDLIILSDNDEIPNLKSNQFKNCNKKLIIFKQLFFYYKFNLLYDLMFWHGSKACKKKDLKSFTWLRYLKSKEYLPWRLDTYFTNSKYINLEIIHNGGWHFTNVKTPEELYIKLKNFGHHNEFDESNITLDLLKKQILEHKVHYNHFADKKSENKYEFTHKLKKSDMKILPEYLQSNKEKYIEWFA